MPLVTPVPGGSNQIEVEITGKADDLQGKLNELDKSFDSFAASAKSASTASASAGTAAAMSWKQMGMVMGTVVSVAGSVAGAIGSAMNAFTDYAGQVDKVRLLTGQSAEESSRLIQVLGGVGIEYSQLNTVMDRMTKNGIPATIDSLASLSDAYLALPPGLERAKFLMDNFGKSGADMGKLLEQGSAAIYGMNDAVNSNLILSQDAIDSAREYEQAVGNLNDTWSSLKVTLGSEVVPVASRLVDMFNDLVSITSDVETSADRALNPYARLLEIGKQFVELRVEKGLAEQAGALDEFSYAADRAAVQYELLQTATAEASKENTNFISLVQNVQKETDSYNEKQEKLLETLGELRDTQAELTEGTKEYTEVSNDIDEVIGKMEENAVAHEEASNRIIFSLLQARLAVDGLSEAETTFLLQQGVNLGIFDEQTAQIAQGYMDMAGDIEQSFVNANTSVATNLDGIFGSVSGGMDTIGAAASGAAGAVDNLIGIIKGLINLAKKPINFVINILGNGASGSIGAQVGGGTFGGTSTSGSGGGGTSSGNDELRATGSGGYWETVPPGFSNDSFRVGLTSGEKFSVKTQSESNSEMDKMAQLVASIPSERAIAKALAAELAKVFA
jgi:hypothetical protein